MLKHMPILHVLRMKESAPTNGRANNCGGHMFTSGPGV